MPVEAIERAIGDACVRLASSAATARRCHEHYLDGLGGGGGGGGGGGVGCLLLATQSPGGPLAAYLRPVYEQMALRIALGCTQPSVSQAILGEGNDAATRLVQAGDAIYNDRRGEGDNPVMRIAMLPTRERLELIAAIRGLGERPGLPAAGQFRPRRARGLRRPPAVFRLRGRLFAAGRRGPGRPGAGGRHCGGVAG